MVREQRHNPRRLSRQLDHATEVVSELERVGRRLAFFDRGRRRRSSSLPASRHDRGDEERQGSVRRGGEKESMVASEKAEGAWWQADGRVNGQARPHVEGSFVDLPNAEHVGSRIRDEAEVGATRRAYRVSEDECRASVEEHVSCRS